MELITKYRIVEDITGQIVIQKKSAANTWKTIRKYSSHASVEQAEEYLKEHWMRKLQYEVRIAKCGDY